MHKCRLTCRLGGEEKAERRRRIRARSMAQSRGRGYAVSIFYGMVISVASRSSRSSEGHGLAASPCRSLNGDCSMASISCMPHRRPSRCAISKAFRRALPKTPSKVLMPASGAMTASRSLASGCSCYGVTSPVRVIPFRCHRGRITSAARGRATGGDGGQR